MNDLNALCPDCSGCGAFFTCYHRSGDMKLHPGVSDVEAVELLRFLILCHNVVETGICFVFRIRVVGKPERVAAFFKPVLERRIALNGDCRMLRRHCRFLARKINLYFIRGSVGEHNCLIAASNLNRNTGIGLLKRSDFKWFSLLLRRWHRRQ